MIKLGQDVKVETDAGERTRHEIIETSLKQIYIDHTDRLKR